MSGEVRSIAPKRSQTTQSPSKKEAKQSANSLEVAKSLIPPPKETYVATQSPSKKVSKQSENSWEDAVSPQKKPNDAIPAWKSVKTVGKLVRRRSLSPKEAKRRNPKRLTQSPSKKVSKQSANSWEDATKEEANSLSKQVAKSRQRTQSN